MGTKETMVSAPLVVLLYDRTFLAGSFREAWRRHRGVYLGLAATWLVVPFLVVATHGRGGTAGFGAGVPWLGYALTQVAAVPHYLRLALFPYPLIFDYGTRIAAPSLGLAAEGLVIGTLFALTLWALVARPAIGFLGGFFFAVLAPSSSVVPVATQTIAEHRMYLPLAAVVVAAVLGIRALTGLRYLACAVAIAAVLACCTWSRNATYRTDQSLWADTLRKCPQNERAHLNLALDLEKDPGTVRDAVSEFRQALALRPDYPEADNDLAVLLESMPGHSDEPAELLRRAIRLDPGYADAHYNLGNVLSDAGRNEEALAEYREAIRLRPLFPEAQSNLASTLGALGRSDEAIANYEEALRAAPDNPAIRYNLALELMRHPDRRDEAVRQLGDVLRIQPANASALDLLNQLKAGR
jgi:Flp pilus assembly protein TadD